MNRTFLSTALLTGLGLAYAANAQEFDDRWYLTGSAGYNLQDGDRRTSDAPMVAIGLGKFVTRQWSIDGELNYQNPSFDSNISGANSELAPVRTVDRHPPPLYFRGTRLESLRAVRYRLSARRRKLQQLPQSQLASQTQGRQSGCEDRVRPARQTGETRKRPRRTRPARGNR